MNIGKFSVIVKNHYICIIIELVIILIGILTLWLAGSQDALNYLGLSSSILAIVLGVVVIIFTMFQSHRSEQNLSKMGENINEMQSLLTEAPRIIRESIDIFKEKASLLERKTDSLINIFNTPQVEKGILRGDAKSFTFTLSNLRIFIIFVLYCAVKSTILNKKITVNEIVRLNTEPKNKEAEVEFIAGVTGILYTLEGILGIKNITVKTTVTFDNIPENFEVELSKELENREEGAEPAYKSYIKETKKKIDNFIDNLPPR